MYYLTRYRLVIHWLSMIVSYFSQDDDLSKLREGMMKKTKEQRKKIVDQKVAGNTPLFTACYRGKVHFVNFLLNECGADMEKRGQLFIVELFIYADILKVNKATN